MSAIFMRRGYSFIRKLTITRNGEPLMLAEGEIIRFGVAGPCDTESLLIQKQYTAADQAADGSILLRIAPGDTAAMRPGSYEYDIGWQTGDDYIPVISQSEFKLLRGITSYKEAT